MNGCGKCKEMAPEVFIICCAHVNGMGGRPEKKMPPASVEARALR